MHFGIKISSLILTFRLNVWTLIVQAVLRLITALLWSMMGRKFDGQYGTLVYILFVCGQLDNRPFACTLHEHSTEIGKGSDYDYLMFAIWPGRKRKGSVK